MDMLMDTQNFAHNLKLHRKARANLSQRRMAAILGISRSCYARYERGTRMPPAWVAAKAARYFDVTVEELFEKEVKPHE